MYTVSVIVPIYNGEHYISRCLESLAAQVLPDMQIILVNDGSTDGSEAICQKYVKLFSNFFYYSKPNGGSASARNVGLDQASGEYIGFVDSDDWIEPDMYQKMYDAAREYEADIIFNPMKESGERYFFSWPEPGFYDKTKIEKSIYPEILPHPTATGTFRSLDWGNWSRLFKRELIVNNNIRYHEESRRCEDLLFCLWCTIKARTYYIMEGEKLYHYCGSETSKSRHYTKNMWEGIRALLTNIRTLCESVEEYDFSDGVKYCILYFCVVVLRNEVFGPKDRLRNKRIRDILVDSLCKEAIGLGTDRKYNKEYSAVFRAMKTEKPGNVVRIMKWYAFKKKYLAPIIKKIRH